MIITHRPYRSPYASPYGLRGLGDAGYTCSGADPDTICAPTTQTALFKQLQTLANQLRAALGVDYWPALTVDGSIGPATTQLVQTIADNAPIVTTFLSQYRGGTTFMTATDIAGNAAEIATELQAILNSVSSGASTPKPAPTPTVVPGGTAPSAPSAPPPATAAAVAAAAAAAAQKPYITLVSSWTANQNNAALGIAALLVLWAGYRYSQQNAAPAPRYSAPAYRAPAPAPTPAPVTAAIAGLFGKKYRTPRSYR